MIIRPLRGFSSTLAVPGDKSISHRYALLGGAAAGETVIHNYSSSRDCHSTLSCLEQLGVGVAVEGTEVHLAGRGKAAWKQPAEPLDAGNSGTTIRLLSGLLAGCPFSVVISGDESLSRRPMKRIIDPLRKMGAGVESRDAGLPPLRITGGSLRPLVYQPPAASAQVKSCVLLAGLSAAGRTTVIESKATRDHTERALPLFGVPVDVEGAAVSVSGPAGRSGAE